MALAGICISRSGIDIALASAQNGELQSSASMPLPQIDAIEPDADALVAPFTSLANQHPAELTVLAISTQVRAAKKYDVLPKIDHPTDARFTIDYIDAYIAGLKADELAPAPSILFIEITPSIFAARLVTVRLEGANRICVPLHVEAITSTSTLATFVGQLSAWARAHNHKVSQVVFLDPPSGSVDSATLQSALSPDSPVITVDGAQLAKYAASHAFINLDKLRQDEELDDMGQYVSPLPISFVANGGAPTLIIQRSEPLPAVQAITFTTTEENQKSVVVELAFGTYDSEARVDEKLVFAKVTLEGLRPRPAGEGQITVSVFVSPDWGNMVEVFEGSERKTAGVSAVFQIPYPFDSPAYNAAKSLSS